MSDDARRNASLLATDRPKGTTGGRPAGQNAPPTSHEPPAAVVAVAS